MPSRSFQRRGFLIILAATIFSAMLTPDWPQQLGNAILIALVLSIFGGVWWAITKWYSNNESSIDSRAYQWRRESPFMSLLAVLAIGAAVGATLAAAIWFAAIARPPGLKGDDEHAKPNPAPEVAPPAAVSAPPVTPPAQPVAKPVPHISPTVRPVSEAHEPLWDVIGEVVTGDDGTSTLVLKLVNNTQSGHPIAVDFVGVTKWLPRTKQFVPDGWADGVRGIVARGLVANRLSFPESPMEFWRVNVKDHVAKIEDGVPNWPLYLQQGIWQLKFAVYRTPARAGEVIANPVVCISLNGAVPKILSRCEIPVSEANDLPGRAR